jgi:hypothetical protein
MQGPYTINFSMTSGVVRRKALPQRLRRSTHNRSAQSLLRRGRPKGWRTSTLRIDRISEPGIEGVPNGTPSAKRRSCPSMMEAMGNSNLRVESDGLARRRERRRCVRLGFDFLTVGADRYGLGGRCSNNGGEVSTLGWLFCCESDRGTAGGIMTTRTLNCRGLLTIHADRTVSCSEDTCSRTQPLDTALAYHSSIVICRQDACAYCTARQPARCVGPSAFPYD